MRSFWGIPVALVLAATVPGRSQTPVVADHLTQAELLEKARPLEAAAAAGNGAASVKLASYAHHFTMVAVRTKDGQAERHDRYADLFVVLKGRATVLTGGTIPDAHETAPGEFLGAAVVGGTVTALAPGDVLHIPAGMCHQILIAKGDDLVYFVVKAEEK